MSNQESTIRSRVVGLCVLIAFSVLATMLVLVVQDRLAYRANQLKVVAKLEEFGAQCSMYLYGVEAISIYPHKSIPKFGDKQVHLLKNLPDLKSLHLHGTAITDSGLEELETLPMLEIVDISQTAVTDEGLQCLKTQPRLREIHAWNSPISSKGVSAFEKDRPDVEILYGTTE